MPRIRRRIGRIRVQHLPLGIRVTLRVHRRQHLRRIRQPLCLQFNRHTRVRCHFLADIDLPRLLQHVLIKVAAVLVLHQETLAVNPRLQELQISRRIITHITSDVRAKAPTPQAAIRMPAHLAMGHSTQQHLVLQWFQHRHTH